MATRLLIKRSTTDSYPSNVVFGELAYSTNGHILYIGDESNTAISIAGKRYPGTLVANQTITVDANSSIDLLKSTDLIILDSANVANTLTVSQIIADGIQVANTLTVNGDIVLRGSSLQLGDGGDVIQLGASVNSHIIPTTSNTFTLGSSDNGFWSKVFTKNIFQERDIALDRKVDILWKKVGFDRTRTDEITQKTALEESILSKIFIAPSDIWTDAEDIPATKPGTSTAIVTIRTNVECTEDNTSTSLRTWKTDLTNWIPPRFGLSYFISVYSDNAGALDPVATGTLLPQNGSGNNDEWYFDYQSGVLNFVGDSLPSSMTAGKSVFITGATYSGNTGFTGSVLSGAELVNATITSLSSPLNISDGGTGVTSFVANTLLASSNTSEMSFKTGSNGQIMIITDNDVEFSDLDGGTY